MSRSRVTITTVAVILWGACAPGPATETPHPTDESTSPEQNVPATTQTRFRIGSVSKSLTSVAIGRLVQDGQLDLDSPVQRSVPGFPEKRYPITVRQLASHLAGIRHYDTGEFENREHYATVTEGLAIFAADSLLFEPGTQFSYSSYRYNLLGAVIEGAGSVGGTAHLIIYSEQRVVAAVLVNSDYTFINAIPRYAEPFLPPLPRP